MVDCEINTLPLHTPKGRKGSPFLFKVNNLGETRGSLRAPLFLFEQFLDVLWILGGLSAQIIGNFDYFKLFPLFENSKGIDMDNINRPCVFYGKIIANAPVSNGSQWWYVLNIGFGSGYDLIQITVQNQNTDKVYIRRATNNKWVNGSWSVFSGTSL